jgi:hypothetical protein
MTILRGRHALKDIHLRKHPMIHGMMQAERESEVSIRILMLWIEMDGIGKNVRNSVA